MRRLHRPGTCILLHGHVFSTPSVTRLGGTRGNVDSAHRHALAVVITSSIDPPAQHVYVLTPDDACWMLLPPLSSTGGNHEAVWEP